jgi:hypothetical protein
LRTHSEGGKDSGTNTHIVESTSNSWERIQKVMFECSGIKRFVFQAELFQLGHQLYLFAGMGKNPLIQSQCVRHLD